MDERPPRQRRDDDAAHEPTEGVRIIGAEEAAEAIERGDVARRRPEGAPRFGDRPTPPPEGPRPSLRFPLGADDDPADVGRPRAGSSLPPTGMPHWTEPPTGEVPRILPETGEGGEELEAWSSFAAGPRWRDQPGDWDADFDDATMLHDDQSRVGALDESDRPGPDDFFTFDGLDEVDAEPAPTPIRTRARPAPQPPTPASAGSGSAMGQFEAPDRDVRMAVISGLTLAAVALVCFAVGPAAVVVLVAAVLVVAAAELFDALRRAGHQPATLLGLVAVAGLTGAVYWRGEAAYPLVLSLTVVFGMLWYLTGVARVAPSANLGLTLLGVGWVGVLGSFAALLLKFGNDQGLAYLLAAVVVTAAHDVGSLVAGRRMGRSAMAPTISPNKTWEGLVGGTVAAVVVSVVLFGVVPGMYPWDAGSALALALVVSVVAPLGDLCESMVKRDLGLKDLSAFLPGHGGLLDRFDALLFVLPATYYLVRLLDIGL